MILKTVHGKWTVTHRLDKDTPRETHSNYPFNFISVTSDTTKSEEKGKKKKIEQTKNRRATRNIDWTDFAHPTTILVYSSSFDEFHCGGKNVYQNSR